MSTITKSVGKNGANIDSDVKAVQKLINQNLYLGPLESFKPLDEDGLIGAKTIDLIKAFQGSVMKMQNPDGLVEPGGQTLTALNNTARKARPSNVTAFIDMVLPAAKKVKATYKVPISVLIAQAALESGWGNHVKGNAYFGIKGKSQKNESTLFTTREFLDGKEVILKDTFRAYADFGEAAEDYGLFLSTNPRYKPCFTVSNNPLAFADKLQAAGYATDPQYAVKLKGIIQTYYLEDYDR